MSGSSGDQKMAQQAQRPAAPNAPPKAAADMPKMSVVSNAPSGGPKSGDIPKMSIASNATRVTDERKLSTGSTGSQGKPSGSQRGSTGSAKGHSNGAIVPLGGDETIDMFSPANQSHEIRRLFS